MYNPNEYIVLREAIKLPEFNNTIERLKNQFSEEFYSSKADRWEKLESLPNERFTTIICSIFTYALINGENFYQMYVGALEYLMPHENKIDRLKTIAEVIAICIKSDLLTINSFRDHHLIDTEFELDNLIDIDSHSIQYSCTEPIENNQDVTGHVILGSRFNKHDGFICPSVLERLNKVEFKLDKKVLFNLQEVPNSEPIDDYQKEQWEKFWLDSRNKYEEILAKDIPFHFFHKYDTRGRIYCQGYHVNYQGSGFKKAIIQLAKEEKVSC